MKKVEAESLGAVHTHTHTHTIHLENNRINNRKIAENKIAELAIRNRKGITLIALVITIIVLLILAGVSIAMLTGTNGILTQAQKAKLSTELSSYKEQLELYKTEKLAENREFLESTLTVGKESLKYNTQPEGETGNIKTVIPSIKDEYIDKVEIIKGALLINTQDKNEIEIAKSLGIAANPYDIVNGELLSSNGNLLLMDDTGTITIPDSVTKIGEGAFANLSGLKTIIIPGTVKEIGSNAFAYNKTLENVIMQEGVEVIGNMAFSNCENLKNVVFPNSLLKIGDMGFYQCYSLTQVELPDKIEEIKSYCFHQCINLKSLKLPSNLKAIRYSALNSIKISEIKIPETVEQIEDYAFSGCSNLESIDLIGNSKYIYENGMLMSKEKDKILFILDKYMKSITTFAIPEGITSFNIAVTSYTNINKLIIPSTLVGIGEEIFPRTIAEVEVTEGNNKFVSENSILYDKDTKRLKMCYSKEQNIKIQEGIEAIGGYSFMQATNAVQIDFPDSVTALSGQVFSSCSKLKQINLGKNVSYIDPVIMLFGCNANVSISNENPNYVVEDGILYSKDKSKLIACLEMKTGEIVIPSTVKIIGRVAFDCQKISKVTLKEGIEVIEGLAFTTCGNLREVIIPRSIKQIEPGAFERCGSLTKISIQKTENSISGAPWGAPKGMKVVNWDS